MISGPVLYAEDEEDDVFLLRHAFKETGIPNRLLSVPDGEAALRYLSGSGEYSDRCSYPLPILLLLDINMPMVSGLEVLQWVRAQPDLRFLPVLILSSSSQNTDVRRAYELGANGYLVKPSALGGLINTSKAIRDYWLIQNFPPPLGEAEPRQAGATLSVLPDA
jgi:CheY-like chemotaxis protein